MHAPAPNGTAMCPTLRGERPTESLDVSDADTAFRDLLGTTRDGIAAAILVAGIMIAEAIRETE